MLTTLDRTTDTPYLLVAYAIFGLGSGLVNPPITNTAVSGMPPAQAGVAAAVASTSRQVGATLGVAVLGAVAAAGGTHGNSFATATHAAWWIVVVLGVVVTALGFVTTTAWAGRTATRTAAALAEDAEGAPDAGPRAAGAARPQEEAVVG
jgi:MFS family permease